MTAQAATGAGITAFVGDFRHKELTISTTGLGAGDSIVFKVQGTSQEFDTAPAFGSAASTSNEWEYIQIVDLEDGSTLDGDDGVTIATTDAVRKFAINVDSLTFVTVNITTISDTVNTSGTVRLNLYND